jgi:hypothetical protein
MSGPKVVRIVTHEEIVAICEGHLARLNAAAGRVDQNRSAQRLAD